MAKKIKPLVIPFDDLLVTRSKREYRDTVREWGAQPPDIGGADGMTTYVPGRGCIIWVSKKLGGVDLYGIAAHEASHAAQDMLHMIGEHEPASEEFAYMVQSIAVGIVLACEKGDDR